MAVIDRTTALLVIALRRAQIRSIVLKGPAFARWLYDDGSLRSYADSDLLISAVDIPRAEEILTSLGYSPMLSDADVPPFNRRLHAHTWSAASGALIDLHHTLDGATASSSVVWMELTREAETIELSGTTVEILGPTAQAVHVALHAAAHGAAFPGPLEDLARALDRVERERWRSAADLASRLGALEPFTAGLSILPAGGELAADLNLSPPSTVEVKLRAAASPPLTVHLEWLDQTDGIRAKLSLALRLLLPPRAFMEADVRPGSFPRLGLARAYVSRLTLLPRHAPAALLAWRRARR